MAFCRGSATWIIPPTALTKDKSSAKFDKGTKSPKKVKTVARQFFLLNESTPLLGVRR